MRMTQEQYDAYVGRSIRPTDRPAPAAKPQKYRNRKVTDDEGITHDSKLEYRRWQELQLRECAGEIRSLRRQVPFALVVGDVLVCRYVADFVYICGVATIVEDCKSPPTRKKPEYRIKVKLMQAIHSIQIREVM